MEYNKNRFQKTNDKKILHKVKKQWVVLSVALLAALGGGATVATTHASANANGANGQNNDQETTIKNRINQNLKMAQSQNANNASQGQTKQVNVNSLSSDQITKQANLLHNQMLLGATQGTNPKTANGRQAARKNARVNRVNANTSAAASVANRKPAANANHSRMFGAAAPSANFGAMRKPEMRLGASHNIGDEPDNSQEQAILNKLSKFQTVASAVRNAAADKKTADSGAYKDLMNIVDGLSKYKSAQPISTWQNDVDKAVSDLDTIKNNDSSNNSTLKGIDTKADFAKAGFDGKAALDTGKSFNLNDMASNIQTTFPKYANDLTQANDIFNDPDKAAAYHNIVNNVVRNLPNESEQQAKKDVNDLVNATNSNNVHKAVSDLRKLENNSDVQNPTSAFSVNNLKSFDDKNVRSGYNKSDYSAASSAYQDLMSLASNENSSFANGEKLGSDTTSAGSQTWIQNLNRAKNDLDALNRNAKVDSDSSLDSLDSEVDAVANDLEAKNGVGSLAFKVLGLSASSNYTYNDIAKSLSGKNNKAHKAVALARGLNAISKHHSSDYNHIVQDAANIPNRNSDSTNSQSDITNLKSEASDFKDMHDHMNNLASTFSGSNDGNTSDTASSGDVKAIHDYLTSNAQDASNLASSAASRANSISNELAAENSGARNYYVPIHIVYENADGKVQQTYDQANNSYINKSDVENVHIVGNESSKATFMTSSGNNQESSVSDLANGKNIRLYDNGDMYIHHNLGSDTGYSLNSVSDNGNNVNNNSLTAYIQSAGNWNWGTSAGTNQSMPTFYYRANTQTNNNINVRLINQNGYKVTASVAAPDININSAVSGSSTASGDYTEDITYSGANSYGDTINILTGLSSVSSYRTSMVNGSTSTIAGQYNSNYDFGFSNGDTNPSFSDYTFTSKEQNVTLPVHGRAISNGYTPLTLNIITRNHKGSFVSSATFKSNVDINYLASIDGISGGAHYGDLLKVDPASFAPKGTAVASSDYNVDPYRTSSDNSKQDVPYIYVSENGPKWINVQQRSDAQPSDITNNIANMGKAASDNSVSDMSAPGNIDKTTTDPNVITFDYHNGAYKGTVTPIHVTYRDQYNNVVTQGLITPTASDYGDLINIPDGINTTRVASGNASGLNTGNHDIFSNATLPSGYSIDYNKDKGYYDSYAINSDYNNSTGSYKNYVPGYASSASAQATTNFPSDNPLGSGANVKNAGNDITIYVDGHYTETNNNLYAKVVHENSDGKSDKTDVIPLQEYGFNGQTLTLRPSDYMPQANQASGYNDGTKNNNPFIGSDSNLNDDGLTNQDHPYTVKFNNGQLIVNSVSSSKNSKPTTTQINASDYATVSDANKGNGIVFYYRKPTNKTSTHAVHVHYFFPNMSDANSNTPNRKYIPIDNTKLKDDTTGSSAFNLSPYIANPPKGYQYVHVMNDSNTNNAVSSGTNISNLNVNSTVSLNTNNSSDNIDIEVIPTAGSITFHYYNQNGKPVQVNPSDGPTSAYADSASTKKYAESAGVDYTDDAHYRYAGSDTAPNVTNNTHTEFGNTPDQDHNAGYYSRYGTYADVNNIPVPVGYHIDTSSNHPMKRYYLFGREHQDVNVMVVGNKDDVANTPSTPKNPPITPGDKGNTTNHPNNGQQNDPDTIWVTVHEEQVSDGNTTPIRSYQVPYYVSGNTGDNFHIYASDFTPEAQNGPDGQTDYHFSDYGANQIHDGGANGSGNDNYVQEDGYINSDGTVTANNDTTTNTTLKTPNHVDFYYKIVDHAQMKPINVVYMDGSTQVGFKQITPTKSDNYPGQTIEDTITYDNHKNQGSTPSDNTKIPTGYEQTHPSDTYPTTVDTNRPQNIVIPVKRDHSNKASNTAYTVITNFYSGSDYDHRDLVATSASTVPLDNDYSGEENFVSATSSATYNNVAYKGGAENASATVRVTSDGATPGVITYNYYSSASVNPKQSGAQNSSVTNTIMPIYVQYYTGSNSALAANGQVPSNDYLVGNDNKLTGKSGASYSDVTKVVPVPEGYYVNPSDQSKVSPAFNDQTHQMDIHISRDNPSDENFPLNIVLEDHNGNKITNYTDNFRIPNNTSDHYFKISDYNPNKNDFTSANSSDMKKDTNSKSIHVINSNDQLNYPSGTFYYRLNNSQSDVAPITVNYYDVDTGQHLNDASNQTSDTINGNYVGQNMSDITYANGQKNNGTYEVPSGYKVVSDQNVDYHVSNNHQYANILVKRPDNNSNQYHYHVNIVEINNNGSDVYLADQKSGVINNNMTLDPHNFIPKSDYQVSHNYTADPDSTTYYVDPADHDKYISADVKHDETVTYLYRQGHINNYDGAIVLRYFNQDGQQVGYTDYMNGQGTDDNGNHFNRYGQQTDVNSYKGAGNNSHSHGENTPDGYSLDPNQTLNYTFNNNVQNVDLFVHGNNQQTSLNIYIHKETPNDPTGNNPSDVNSISYPVNSPAGSNISFDPYNYVPTGFHTDPRYTNNQSVKVNPDGSITGQVNFYYNLNNDTTAHPYIIRYVNQNGKEVGYDDVVADPNTIARGQNTGINLTKPSDGGEAVPYGYSLTNSDKDVATKNVKFGNNHTITLPVQGNHEKVPLTVHLIELSSDGRPSDASHDYNNTEMISDFIDKNGSDKPIHVGDQFTIDADQYLHNTAPYSAQGLPNNGSDTYSDAPANSNYSPTKLVTVEQSPEVNGGKPYLSFADMGNGVATNDNQAVFYYNYNNNKPAPITVDYIDADNGNLIKSDAAPTDGMSNLGQTIPDVTTNTGAAGATSTVPQNYHKVNNVAYPATIQNDPQNIFVPVVPSDSKAKVIVHVHIVDKKGNLIKSDGSYTINNPGPAYSTQTYSPYNYMPKDYPNAYLTNSDEDQTLTIRPNSTQNITFNYMNTEAASADALGTIIVHYVTSGANSSSDTNDALPSSLSGYHQVDQESDHGMSGDPFNLTNYLNDIPSYHGNNGNNYYHLVTTNNGGDNNSAVLGYNDIKGDYTPYNSTNKVPVSDKYTFNIGNSHPIYGDSTYAITTNGQPTGPASNTQDIYVWVAPNNNVAYGYNGGDTGNASTTSNPSYNLPTNQANNDDADEDNGTSIFNTTGNGNNDTNPSYNPTNN